MNGLIESVFLTALIGSTAVMMCSGNKKPAKTTKSKKEEKSKSKKEEVSKPAVDASPAAAPAKPVPQQEGQGTPDGAYEHVLVGGLEEI